MYDTRIPRDGTAILRETEKAICIAVPTAHVGRPRPVWLPKSQVAWKAPSAIYGETLHVAAWLALREKL